MKKFLVILMVVAMTSFLFVGCLPGVTPGVDDDEDDVDVGVKTDTPIITGAGFSILATTTPTVNSKPSVNGIGVPGSVIKLYVDSVYAGIAYADTDGIFTVGITGITLTEGERKVYVTATASGLAESDKSTEYTFIYDKTAPKIASAVADSTDQAIVVTFDEPVNTALIYTTAELAAATAVDTAAVTALELTWTTSALYPDNWTISIDSGEYTYLALSSTKIRIVVTVGSMTMGDIISVSSLGIADIHENTSTTATASVFVVTD